MYGGAECSDSNAIKAANHELTGLITYMATGTPGLCFPLMALVDYKGYSFYLRMRCCYWCCRRCSFVAVVVVVVAVSVVAVVVVVAVGVVAVGVVVVVVAVGVV